MQIIQTRDYVVLNAEYATSIRIVPLHLDENPIAWPQWRGVSLGRWEGDTLVVRNPSVPPGTNPTQDAIISTAGDCRGIHPDQR